ncbi:hypothetical protein ACLB2K_039730 [Fragaria x ananassa]
MAMTKELRLTEIQGRGRSLMAAQPLEGGQIILRDSPILLYSALPPLPSPFLRPLFQNPKSPHPNLPLPLLQPQLPLRRPLLLPHSLGLPIPRQITKLPLPSLRPPRRSPSPSSLLDRCLQPRPRLFSVELTAALLAKDKLNAFGLMEPPSETGARSSRAYGIYPKASFFNHDCLPNACRFDYDLSTEITVRMIHDVPEGREICLSYFPVNEPYSRRQRILAEDYGFVCQCDRCKVEANWSDNEEVAEEEGGSAEGMDEDQDQEMGGDSEPEGGSGSDIEAKAQGGADFPHAYFFVRFMCSRTNCWATLAPLPPKDDGTSSDAMGMQCVWKH